MFQTSAQHASPSPSTTTPLVLTVYRVCYNTRARFRDVPGRRRLPGTSSSVVFVGAPKSVTSKLQRVVSGSRKFDRGLMQLLHADLHWLDVPERVKYKLCMMMCRCQDGTAPQYLTAHWTPVSETASRQHLRSAASHQLTVPPHRRVTYSGRAFSIAGPSTWNSLPKRLRDPPNNTSVFGRLLRVLMHAAH